MMVLRTLLFGPSNGYQIARTIEKMSDQMLQVDHGSLYPALHRLEGDGALEAKWQPSEKGPSRRYYRITKKGSGILARYEREWSAVRVAVDRLGPQPT